MIIKLSPIKSIRAKCLECQGNHYKLIRNCESRNCALFAYRFGNNPKRQGIGPKTKVFTKLIS